jgi:hypothetical protein
VLSSQRVYAAIRSVKRVAKAGHNLYLYAHNQIEPLPFGPSLCEATGHGDGGIALGVAVPPNGQIQLLV